MSLRCCKEGERGQQRKSVQSVQKIEYILPCVSTVIRNSVELLNLGVYSLSHSAVRSLRVNAAGIRRCELTAFEENQLDDVGVEL